MIVHKGHTDRVNSVAFSPDGKSVVSGSNDDTIRTWNAHSSSPIGDPLRGHDHWVRSVSYSPLGNIIASGSWDWTIRLWDFNTRRLLGQPIRGNHPFLSVAFSSDAKLIASGCGWSYNSDRFTVQLWDVESRAATSGPFKGHTDNVQSVQFSPDGSRLVSGSFDKTVRIWDIERGMTVIEPLSGHTEGVRSIAVSPNGSQIISGSWDRTLRLWDARNGIMIGNPFKAWRIHSVDFSPRGTYVVSGEDGTVRLWDIRTGREVQSFKEHMAEAYSVAFSPCSQFVVSGSDKGKVSVRSVSCDYPDSVDDVKPRVISSQMSTSQIFDCLTESGCVDLSSQMDTGQSTAMIVSGGGFGDIWKGQLHSGGKVAIKAWRTNTMEPCSYQTVKRAARELFLWSRMDHPNIHRLQGVIMFRGQYLGMVSEWMDNGNLHEYLRKQPGADRYQLCIHVASGLEYMHSCNTVHGDLKAANVLVSSDGIARLSDFDFSIMSEVSSVVFSESSNSRTGSLRWAAPELLLAEVPKRTTQSDIYALGMTMLETLTGEVPYSECRHDYTIIKKAEKGTLPNRPLDLLKDDNKGNMMWRLLQHCWRRNASKRPSPGRILDALVNHISKA